MVEELTAYFVHFKIDTNESTIPIVVDKSVSTGLVNEWVTFEC